MKRKWMMLFAVLLMMLSIAGRTFAAGQSGALIDLHLHLDGSLSPASARELAKMQGIEIPESEEELLELLQVDDDCRDLNEYLEKFDFPGSLLQTKDAISEAVYILECELEKQGLIYAEIRFAPQKHMEKGLSQTDVLEAAIEGMNRSGFRSNLILCCMRGDDNHEQNIETVRVGSQYLNKGVCAIDLAGAEALFPTENFRDIFELAVELGVPFTIHAGEADGPQSVYTALEFGAKRIGHGVRSAEDEALLEQLAREGVTLELCPTSNLNTSVFSSLDEYPLRKIMDAGVRATINTDNMSVSATTLPEEVQKVTAAFSLTQDELRALAKNAADASFADEQTKQFMNREIESRLR